MELSKEIPDYHCIIQPTIKGEEMIGGLYLGDLKVAQNVKLL